MSVVSQLFGQFYEGCTIHYPDSLSGLRTTDPWSSNPEDTGSTIPSRKALELHFSQLVPVWVL